MCTKLISHLFPGKAEEKELVDRLVEIAHLGFPMSLNEVCDVAYEYAVRNGKKGFSKEAGTAGKDWGYAFKERHKDRIRLYTPQQLSRARAESATPEAFDEWFDLYEDLLRKGKIMDENGVINPKRIWNIDKTGITDLPRPRKALCPKGERAVEVVGGERGELSTIMSYVNAAGDVVPPMIIHKAYSATGVYRVQGEWKDGIGKGMVLRATGTGYVDKNTFLQYGYKFIEFLKRNKLITEGDEKNLVILDGHSTHVYNLAFIDLMIQNNVDLISLVPHSTHDSQPWDKFLARAVKVYWSPELRLWSYKKKGRRLPKTKFFSIFVKVWDMAMKKHRILSSWRVTGLYPLDRKRLTHTHKTDPSKVNAGERLTH